MKPIYKIETYTGATLDNTITDKCKSLRVKSALTDQPGTFHFELPGMDGLTKCYDDIALFDIVKIYLGYDSVPTSPLFVGRIENIGSQWSPEYTRVFTGRDQSEVTSRLIRHQYNTGGNTAHSQVDKWAGDCGLGTTQVDADATAVTILSNQSKYDALMREISDYAATISKDWYVDISNNLVWKARPIRTSGVSTLTVGSNIKSYSLTRNINEVYNTFYVFGASEPSVDGTSACSHSQYTKSPTDIPTDHDSYTDALTNWTVGSRSGNGILILDATVPHVGTNRIMGSVAIDLCIANEYIWITRTFNRIMIKDSARLEWVDFWRQSQAHTITLMYIDLYTDATNWFRYTFDVADYTPENANTHKYIMLGPAYEASAGNEKWIRYGDPDWYNITRFRSYKEINSDGGVGEWFQIAVDGLYFTQLRWQATDQDVGSQTTYGVRPMVVTDDRIHSNTEATNYAASIKARYKDAPIQLDVVMPMDTNLLIGDRIPVTLPNENLSAIDFDVIQVEHILGPDGALTHGTLTSKERMRSPLKTTDFPTYMRDINKSIEDIIQGRNIAKGK